MFFVSFALKACVRLTRHPGSSWFARPRIASLGAVLVAVFAAAPHAERGVPTPASVLGFEPCADNTLATYEQIAA